MSIARTESARDSAPVRDQSRAAESNRDLTAAVSDRFREDLSSIFGKPQSQDLTRTAQRDTGTVNDAAERKASVVPDKTFNEFARNNGLDTRQTPDGKLEFSMRYKGEKLTIGSVEKTGDGFKEINKSLKEFTELKKWELENTYGVKFARPGEPGPRQMDRDSKGREVPGKELEVRDPKLREVLGIEAALEKANPSQKSANGKPLTFYFLKNESFAPGMDGAASYYPNVNGGPAVIVDPGSTDRAVITEKDRKDGDTSDHRSIESLMIHELGHNSEEKVFKNPKEQADFYKKMGWAPIPGMPPGQGGWMLKGRDGRGYAPPSDGSIGKWERIDRNGRVTAKVDAERVERLAKEKPATHYFEGPHEVLAEGATMLRLGDGHRTHLMEKNPRLYNLIKGFDQREIDRDLGKGKFIRSYDGKVVPRTDESIKALHDREEVERAKIRSRSR